MLGQDIPGARKVNGRPLRRTSAKDLIRGRELDLLNHFGVNWPAAGHTHVGCPFPDHKDADPSWRWDSSKARWFCACGSGDAMDALQRLNGWDYAEACEYVETVWGGAAAANFPFKGKSTPAPETNGKAKRAAKVWAEASLISGQAAAYLNARGIRLDAWPEAIRFAPALLHTQPGSKERTTHPALIAGLSRAPGGEIEAIGRAWLAADGAGKASIKPNRQVLGSTKGLACWLGKPSSRLVIGEGVEDAASFLTAGEPFACASMGVANLPNIALPAGVVEVVIFADRAKEGSKEAYDGAAHIARAKAAWEAAGVTVRVVVASAPHKDANDVLRAEGAEAVRAVIDGMNETALDEHGEAADPREAAGDEAENEAESFGGENEEDAAPLDIVAELGELARIEPAFVAVTRKEHAERLGLSLKDFDQLLSGERQKLKAEARASERKERDEADCDEDLYFTSSRGTFWRKTGYNGEESVQQLANFSARITREVIEDDGVETRKTYELSVELAGFAPRQVIIPAADFQGANWIDRDLPAEAYVHPADQAGPRLRHAIKRRSAPVAKHQLYTHTGWRLIDGKYAFLHGDGAIGADGPVEGVSVKLHSKLKGVRLPAPPDGEELARAVRASLDLLNLAPFDVMAPSLGAVFRAPLGNARYSPFLCAETNAQKSSMAAVLMTHFGRGWMWDNLPLSFTIDTITTMEAVVFQGKDILVVPDDLKYTEGAQKSLNTTADRFFRGIANGAGRGKCFPDGTPRPDKPPRAMVFSTGEEVPPGHSLRSRMMIIPLKRGDVDLDRLTEAQRLGKQGVHAQAMSGYLRWLAPRYESITGGRDEAINRLRQGAEKSPLGRTTDMLVDMYWSWSIFLEFAAEVGAITETGANDMLDDVREALVRLGKVQNEELQGANPVERFIEIIRTLLITGRAHVANIYGSENGGAPKLDPLQWGWRQGDLQALHPCGDRIGWVDGDDLYLSGSAAFAAAREFSRREGSELVIGLAQLVKNLHSEGWLASDGMHLKHKLLTVRVPLRGGARPWAYHFSAKRVMGDTEDD